MSAQTGNGSSDASPSLAGAFAALPSDPTGIDTFVRFGWQAKLAVQSWLATLSDGGPVAVVAEHVEDLVIVETDLLRFAQLKTRNRGSWSAAKICADGHAVHSLIKAYQAATVAGIHTVSRFEVWLEGPPSEDAKTKAFFANPTKAHADIKTKLRSHGLRGRALTDFLSRLHILCHRPARPSIDAVVIHSIGSIWPSLTHQQIVELYERLLNAATAAQAGSEQPAVVKAAIAAGRLDPTTLAAWSPIESQVLLREQLVALCPPLSSATNEQLAERAAAGEATLLELKLLRAGAAPETVGEAIGARADADVARKLAVAAGAVDIADVEALDVRLLGLANSVAALGQQSGSTAPAEHIFHTLMARPADIAATDGDRIFDGDARLVVGHLCGLSDQCRYGWARP